MTTIVDRIGCKLNMFNEDGVYGKDRNIRSQLSDADPAPYSTRVEKGPFFYLLGTLSARSPSSSTV